MGSSLYEKKHKYLFCPHFTDDRKSELRKEFGFCSFPWKSTGKRRVNGKDKRKEAILKLSDNVTAFIRLRHGQMDYLSAGRAR